MDFGEKWVKDWLGIIDFKFLLEIYITDRLGINAYKTLKCDKNQVLYYNVQGFKKWFFWELLAIDGTWPTLAKFYYFYFCKWKKWKV